MSAGLPAPPREPEGYVEASCPPLALYIARDVWEEALRRKGHMVVSLGEYGRFRLRILPEEAGEGPIPA